MAEGPPGPRMLDRPVLPAPPACPPLRVHVVGGGGTASRLLRLLHARSFTLSTGILSASDADARTARELGLPVVEGPDHGTPVSADVMEEQRRWLRGADAVVLTPFAIGPGNLVNLELVDELGPDGPPALWLLAPSEVSKRDYTHGEGTLVYRRIAQRARSTRTAPELVAALLGPPGVTGPIPGAALPSEAAPSPHGAPPSLEGREGEGSLGGPFNAAVTGGAAPAVPGQDSRADRSSSAEAISRAPARRSSS